MCELNICASTRTTRAEALKKDLRFLQPPAASLSGTWTCDGVIVANAHQTSDEAVTRKQAEADPSKKVGKAKLVGPTCDVNFYVRALKKTLNASFKDELNDTLIFSDGQTAVLEDSDYALRFGDGTVWKRRDCDVLVFVDPSVRHGVIPKMETFLKADRKAAKKKMAAALAAKDWAAYAYWDNYQSSVKIVMNALYGGLGSGKGGIFPASAPLAAAITARGRSLICLVKKNIEEKFWLLPDGTCGGFEAENRPSVAQPLKILYGGESCFQRVLQLTSHHRYGQRDDSL